MYNLLGPPPPPKKGALQTEKKNALVYEKNTSKHN